MLGIGPANRAQVQIERFLAVRRPRLGDRLFLGAAAPAHELADHALELRTALEAEYHRGVVVEVVADAPPVVPGSIPASWRDSGGPIPERIRIGGYP